MKIKNLLNQEREGFSGVNHVLTTIMIFLLLLLIPFEPTQSIFKGLIAEPIPGIIAFFTICGGALLPDMDNPKDAGGSAASWDLGLIGSIVTTIMVTISSVITSIFRGKKDVVPNTQHRFFWHTLLIPAILFAIIYFFMPDDQAPLSQIFTSISINSIPTHAIVGIFGVVVCVYIGSHLLIKKLNKFIPVNLHPTALSIALCVLTIVACVMMMDNHDLKVFCYCIAIGYLFHLIGDMFCDSGIPALFPLTGIFGKFFMRIRLTPVTITTGSTIESMLKIVFLAIDILLACIVFFPGLIPTDMLV